MILSMAGSKKAIKRVTVIVSPCHHRPLKTKKENQLLYYCEECGQTYIIDRCDNIFSWPPETPHGC